MTTDHQAVSHLGSHNAQVMPKRLINSLLIFLIRFYQLFISGLLGPACRFTPTCSCYAVDALAQYPLYRALPRIIYRVLRCNPFSRGGYDPLRPESSKGTVEIEPQVPLR